MSLTVFALHHPILAVSAVGAWTGGSADFVRLFQDEHWDAFKSWDWRIALWHVIRGAGLAAVPAISVVLAKLVTS